MKKLLFYLLIFIAYMLAAKNASAQYKSIFGDSSTSWSVIENARCDYINTTSYQVQNKTVRNGKTYYEISGSQSDLVIWGTVIREDTKTGKIYASHIIDSTEYLLIDFSLDVDDSFVLKVPGKPAVVFMVEAIYYVNGLKHIKLNRQHNLCGAIGEQLTFVEGTGTSAGLYNWTFDESGVNSYLLCQIKDKNKVYSNKHFPGECSKYEGSWYPKYNLADARLSPNPTKGNGNVEVFSAQGRILNLKIYDLYGRLIFENTSSKGYFPFSISLQANGIYPYVLTDDLGNTGRGKIVKH